MWSQCFARSGTGCSGSAERIAGEFSALGVVGSAGKLVSSVASAKLEHDAQTLGFRERVLPPSAIGSPQQIQILAFIGMSPPGRSRALPAGLFTPLSLHPPACHWSIRLLVTAIIWQPETHRNLYLFKSCSHNHPANANRGSRQGVDPSAEVGKRHFEAHGRRTSLP